jgi:hypothetical protein
MALPIGYTDREYKAFKENQTDQGVDRRVNDTDANAKLNGIGGLLSGIKYDAISVAYPTTVTEVYAFFTGGLAGTQVATITLTYSTAAKTNLTSAVKT